MELDALILGYEEEHDQEGTPKARLGSFVLRAPNGAEFKAGSGLTQFQRDFYWRESSKAKLRGRVVKCKYEMLSDGGVPLKPTVFFVDDGILFE